MSGCVSLVGSLRQRGGRFESSVRLVGRAVVGGRYGRGLGSTAGVGLWKVSLTPPMSLSGAVAL